MFDLKGKVALVTGGNGGIGLGMAEGLAGAGADVVIAARKAEKSKAAAAALAKRGVRTAVVEVNVSDEASCRAMVAEAAKQMGRIDILVNNAGINIRKPPETYSISEWREILSINLDGAFYCSQAVYPEMKKAGGGKIINIGSMMSLFGAPLTVAYAASKGGIVQMTRGLATAWAKDNIQVNSILPGWIDTELTQRARRYRRAERERSIAHAGRTLGQARGFRRHRGVSCFARVGFHHGHGDPGVRRVLGPRLIGTGLPNAGGGRLHSCGRTSHLVRYCAGGAPSAQGERDCAFDPGPTRSHQLSRGGGSWPPASTSSASDRSGAGLPVLAARSSIVRLRSARRPSRSRRWMSC